MKRNKLRIFHGIVNYGTQAGLFAKALRDQGIDAISVVYYDKFNRFADIQLLHGGHFIQKIFKHIWNWIRRFYWFFRHNTFHFYFGTSLFPHQLDLPLYKLFGKKVIMEYLGFDIQLYQYSINKYGKYTNIGFMKEEGRKHDIKIKKRYRFESKYLDKELVCAPCYSEFVPDAKVLPIAIDIKDYPFTPPRLFDNRLIIMHAPTNKDNKGTVFIEDAINKLIEEGYPIILDLVENVTHIELKKRYIACDLFIDQLTGGWYGTAAIEAMAIGRPTVCFIREDYFKYIDFGEKIPIINATQDTIYDVIKRLFDNKSDLPMIGLRSRQFVEETHDLQKITDSLIQIYLKVWENN
jgi:glycosyltransferase involved in cell wall biosynthesis